MGSSYHGKGIVESVKIKLEEESDSNVKERNISENINKGIVKSVNNKLNEESDSNLKEAIPKNEIKCVIKDNDLDDIDDDHPIPQKKGKVESVNKILDDEVNYCC